MYDAPHPLTAGFDRAAENYDRGRPEYPSAAVDALVRALEIGPRRRVLDLAAGTGKFTRALVPTGATLLALEPTDGMRTVLTRRVPTVELVNGTAEAIDLPDGGVDTVVSAQAFHWFDAVRATHEVARVLRPGGGLGLVWNMRDESIAWVAELTTLLDRWDAGGPRGRDFAWRAPFERTGRFAPLETAEFPFVHRAPPPVILDRVLSISFIAVLPPATRETIARDLLSLLDRHPEAWHGSEIDLPYRTRLFWTRRR